MNNPEMMATLGTQDTGTIKNEQSRDNGNIGYTRHRGNQEWTIQRWWQHWVHKTQGQSRMNNPEIMATLGTQDTGTIKNEQSRDDGNIVYTRHRDNQEWTIQRWWQHCVHKTQDEDKQSKKTQHRKLTRRATHIPLTLDCLQKVSSSYLL